MSATRVVNASKVFTITSEFISCDIWNWFFDDNFYYPLLSKNKKKTYYPLKINLKILSQTSLWRGSKSSSHVGLEYLNFSLLPYCVFLVSSCTIFWKATWFIHYFVLFSLMQLVFSLTFFHWLQREKEERAKVSQTEYH